MSVNLAAVDIILVLWLVWEWTVNGRKNRGQGHKMDEGTRGVLWICYVISFILVNYVLKSGLGRLSTGVWLSWVGILIMVLGIFFRQYAIAILGRHFSATVQIQNKHQLVQAGPYHFLRHPSYSGIILALLGVGVAFMNWAAIIVLLAIPLIGLIHRINVEEKALEQHFGSAYAEYRGRTWRLIPYLY